MSRPSDLSSAIPSTVGVVMLDELVRISAYSCTSLDLRHHLHRSKDGVDIVPVSFPEFGLERSFEVTELLFHSRGGSSFLLRGGLTKIMTMQSIVHEPRSGEPIFFGVFI